MSEYVEKVKKYVPDCNEAAVAGIVKHLGIALRSRDASLVSCSSKDELARVRDSWCKKKLGLTEPDAELDKMIADVCQQMKADQRKDRVTFYYLLAQKVDKVSALA
jgi:hypothetical protein